MELNREGTNKGQENVLLALVGALDLLSLQPSYAI